MPLQLLVRPLEGGVLRTQSLPVYSSPYLSSFLLEVSIVKSINPRKIFGKLYSSWLLWSILHEFAHIPVAVDFV